MEDTWQKAQFARKNVTRTSRTRSAKAGALLCREGESFFHRARKTENACERDFNRGERAPGDEPHATP
ncbi:hypothetical protein ZHAS_00003538 [Anopheles sinensis]|uniref:Uncharacterized protein n=1 Tax=Anopheles sinensis TaxID=74873 RepID=A0A084VEI2_ANOSI|nr:hypothetical protein ZHAS_00003538 [Anopheles sinensis]